jgi:hypothetical protein
MFGSLLLQRLAGLKKYKPASLDIIALVLPVVFFLGINSWQDSSKVGVFVF